ncbi:MAG: histidine kinase [Clostridia bacterium]|nr:histidine kinase [Clostridia bacterium]
MSGWIDGFYIAFLSAASLLSVLGVWFAAIIPGIDRWSKRFFLSYFIVFLLCCLSGILESVFRILPVPDAAFYCVLGIESLLLALPPPMVTVYLLHCSGEDIRKSKLFYAVCGLLAVSIALLLCVLFVDGFSYLTPDRQYYRGPLYPLLLLPLIATLLLNLLAALRRRKRFSRRVFHSFLVAVLPMTLALIVHLFADVFPLLDIGYAASALAMYGLILSDQIEADRKKRQQIANQRADIMVLQMRPHFIYNTMTSIYSLCGQDPKLARQVILDFTNYLRKNFTAVASAAPIPFSSEMEHTRAYLAVEQALYEDGLRVDYDTPHTAFHLPPLTLQPIVENAVKHGRDPDAGAFCISVRTRKTGTGSEIVVADNGRGFDAFDTGEPGVALRNIRQRLEMMCGGRLEIAENPGGGTVVTVTIPDPPAE